MQTRHVPRIDRRYWCGIICASIFGTNLGDYYAHESGLGLGLGLLVLAGLLAATYGLERRDRKAHETYYWLAIIVIRTGATNIADFLAFRVHIPPPLLMSALAMLIAALAARGALSRTRRNTNSVYPVLAVTDLIYWAAMLAAGVFGTVTGDVFSHEFGRGRSALVLGTTFAVVPVCATKRAAAYTAAAYWSAVALGRTAGTCIGDWLAESRMLHIGLPLSTLLTGMAFIATLTIWRSTPSDKPVLA